MEILITGGAGFIGSNLAARAIRSGHRVTVFDNASRPGALRNLSMLRSRGDFEFIHADIRNSRALMDLCHARRFDAVFHQAAQVAVTTSLEYPRTDFEVNALGTLNVLEAIRTSGQNPVFIFSSTNKVYGPLNSIVVRELDTRYSLPELPWGIAETTPLDFHSPYGCSKGAADQYVIDYRRIYGLRTIVFRQSCIYGPGQIGLEDQGWVAWFAICAVLGHPITIYGDGKQVRDVLYIDDLVELYFNAVEAEPQINKFVYNVGGGPKQAISLREMINMLELELGRTIQVRYSHWRPGDQRVYISDIRAACEAFRWSPTVSPREGSTALLRWIEANRDAIQDLVLSR
jgi:CDP-paratose 2-epimerase